MNVIQHNLFYIHSSTQKGLKIKYNLKQSKKDQTKPNENKLI